MTVYNGMPYLDEAVQSVLAQTMSDLELVIVDDGSTDETPEFLRALGDDRVVVVHRENGGTAAAANQGLALCRGEFIARMDADDVCVPHRLARQLEFFERHPDVGVLGSFTRSLGESRIGGIVHLPTEHGVIRQALLDGRHAMSHPSLLIRAEVLRSVGGYWPYRLVDDWDMMLRVSEVTTVANLPEPLLHYRVHRGSLNGSGMQRMRFSIDFARARAEARARGQIEPTPEEFETEWASVGWLERIQRTALVHSLSHYRAAVAERNGPSTARAVPHLIVAGALRPDLVVRRVLRQRQPEQADS